MRPCFTTTPAKRALLKLSEYLRRVVNFYCYYRVGQVGLCGLIEGPGRWAAVLQPLIFV